MGYTHYWYRKEILPQDIFTKAVEDCRKVCEAIGIPLAGWDGSDKAVFTGTKIVFNGCGEFDSHESFVVPRTFAANFKHADKNGRLFACCKTAHKPYDLAVMCCLIVMNIAFGTDVFTVCSDGADASWKPACAACQRHLGYGGDWTLPTGKLVIA